MKSKALLPRFILLFLTLLCVQAQCNEYGNEYDLIPNVPNCVHISPSNSQIYVINVGPQVLTASFNLRWSLDEGQLTLILRSPDGYLIGQNNTAMSGPIRDKKSTSDSFTISRPKPGNWTLEVKSGDLPDGGQDYCLTASLEEALSRGDAWFNGAIKDFLIFGKNEKIPIGIALSAGVNVIKKGNYSLAGLIKDMKSGEEIPIYSEDYLNLGARELTAYFYDLNSSGPYQVSELILYDESREKMDVSFANYTTKEYPQLKPRIPSARFIGSLSDHGSDVNGDGFYDYLTVDVGVHVRKPETYTLMGSLYDAKGEEVVWSMVSASLSPGDQIMHMDFDGKTIERHKVSGPYRLGDLGLFTGSREQNVTVEDMKAEPYITNYYNYSQFVDPVWPEKVLSGSGYGELLLTILVKTVLPVFQGRYSYDVVDVGMPPIYANWTVTPQPGRNGYAYDLPGVHMPGKPNDFTVRAEGVKNLGVGVKKNQSEPGKYYSRMWISSQAKADKDGNAVLTNDMISPGRYQFKVFGDAAENASQVLLEMEVVKKLVINGSFNLSLDTSGFPSGNYSINARAINGSFRLDEINLAGPSQGF
jgi:hypothetical protein